jgi:hypothetical protein
MPRFHFVTISVLALVASVGMASAQQQKKKMTKEEAWSLCTAEVSVIPADQHSQRYARGAACMKKYGFKI